jgi:hypothetical protein
MTHRSTKASHPIAPVSLSRRGSGRVRTQVCKVGNGPCNPMAATDPLAGSPSIAHCMRRIIAAEGSHAVFKGIAPRILFHTPAAAICWTTYEQMKLLLAPQ